MDCGVVGGQLSCRMKGLQIAVLMTILSVLYALPTGIKKRAQYLPLPPKSTNTTLTKPKSQDSLQTLLKKTVTANTSTEELCPTHLVAHNTSDGIVCCVPYFNCGIDHGIKACSKDGERDQCIPCPPGMIQKNNVSSLNMEEAECYTTRNTQNCAIDDMKPSRKYSPVISCLLKCECKNEDCFYGNDPCACNLSNPCPVNYTMNRVTGVCERCPWYAYKDYVGCGTCIVIPELWAQRNTHTPVTEKPVTKKKAIISETTTKASNDTGQADQQEGETVGTTASILVEKVIIDKEVVIGISVAAVIVLGVLLGVIVCCLRRSKMTGSSSRLITDPGLNKPVGASEEIPLTELADGYQTVANRPNIIKGPQPVVEKRNIEGQKFTYEELGAVGGYDGQVDDQKVPNDSFDDIPERLGAPHEEAPLLKNPARHNSGASQRQHVPYSESVASNSDDAQSPLLNEIRKGTIQIDAKSGARPKTMQPKYTRQLSGSKGERNSSAERIPIANRFENCTFKKCYISNSGPALVNSPINDDSSLYTSESSDYSTFNPPVKMPFEVAVLNNRQVVPRKDRQINDIDMQFNLPPNDLDDGEINMSERTTSNNVSVLLNETKSKDDRKHISAKQMKLMSNLDPDSLKPNTSDKDEIFAEKAGGHDENIDDDNGMENDEDQVTFEKSKLDDSLTIKSTEDLDLSMLKEQLNVDLDKLNENEKLKIDLDKRSEKKLSLEIPKPDISRENEADDLKNTEAGSGTTSPASSNGSESGSKRKIKPWGDDKKEEKPVARIEPIRQNSTPESRQEEPAPLPSYGYSSVSQNRDARYGLYMSDLGSDSYPMLHAQHPPSDVANLDDLNSLHQSSINSSVRSQPQSSDPVVSSIELDNEMLLREGPEGCSLQHSSTNCNDESYRHRPDLQRTYSKTVEGNEETNVANNIAENFREETFLKKHDNSDKKTGDKGNKISDNDGTCRCELDDDLDKEKLKNSDAVKDNETKKSKGGNLESEEETAMLKLNEEPKSCQGKSEETLESETACKTESGVKRVIDDSSDDIENEVCADSEPSVEIDIDCLAASETDANSNESVELPMDHIADQTSDSEDSTGDCNGGNRIGDDMKRRES